MSNHLSVFADLGAWYFLDVALKATLYLLLTASAVALLARSSAALRHRVWVVSLTGLLALPVVIALAPQWAWQVVPRQWRQTPAALHSALFDVNRGNSQREALMDNELVPVARAADAAPTHQALDSTLPVVETAPSPVENPQPERLAGQVAGERTGAARSFDWILTIWLCGALLALAPLTAGLMGNLLLRIRGKRLLDANWQRLAATFSERLGLRRPVTLLLSGPRQMPMTFGLWKPCVVLPAEAPRWSPERRRVVLLHELAHVKRFDVPLQILARIASSLYWFHPLVWWSMRRLRLEREHACDDCVLRTGQEADRYASELLEMAHSHRRGPGMLHAALSMARRSQLEGRLLGVLDEHRCRAPANAFRTGGLVFLALALVVGIGVVRPTLEAEALAFGSGNDAASALGSGESVADSRSEMVLTGSVLSPQGKRVPGATIEVIAYDRSGWSRRLPREETIDHYRTRTDGTAHFRLVLPRSVSRPRRFMSVVASSEGLLTVRTIDTRLTGAELELKLEASKDVRLQLIDSAGNPLSDVEPYWNFASVPPETMKVAVPGWPRFSRSDKEGYVTIRVPVSTKMLSFHVDDKRVGSHAMWVNPSEEPLSVVLKPARFLDGKVTDANSGKPVVGAEIVIMEEPFRRVLTDANGGFRAAKGAPLGGRPEGHPLVHVYPPADSELLFQSIEWKWPSDGVGDMELSIDLRRGIVVEGQVVEKGTGLPVENAAIYVEQQRNDNPHFDPRGWVYYGGSEMKYLTDSNGKFRLPVRPGPGRLLVHAPTLDYVHVQSSDGVRHHGKPGLGRGYYDAAVRLNLKEGEAPQPLTIQLERGVTLRRNVVRPDGQPATGKAFARSYLQNRASISSYMADVPITDGILELPGFEPEHSNPLFILDREHHCGVAASPNAAEVGLNNPPIRLGECGAAKFRFVSDKGGPLADYGPTLLLIITPGAPATHHIEPDQPFWSDSIIWQNVVRPAKIPKTDADGRVTVKDLIPGATYRLSYVNKGDWDQGYEFTVRAGQTTDVGKVTLSQSD